jgi:hypothetical protein
MKTKLLMMLGLCIGVLVIGSVVTSSVVAQPSGTECDICGPMPSCDIMASQKFAEPVNSISITAIPLDDSQPIKVRFYQGHAGEDPHTTTTVAMMGSVGRPLSGSWETSCPAGPGGENCGYVEFAVINGSVTKFETE